MPSTLPDSVIGRQPHSVSGWGYPAEVVSDLKTVLRDNVRRLLGLAEGESGVSRLIAAGLSNGNAQRVLKGETSVGLNVLAQLAAALNVEPWQLCVPDLQPDRLPSLEPASFTWPFRKIDPEVVTGLTGTPAMQIENGLLASLATLSISPRKRAAVRAA